MFLDEFLEAVLDDRHAQLVVVVGILLLKPLQLDEKALLKVGGADSRRIELMDDFQHLADIIFCYLQIHGEEQVVHNVGDGSAQIAVVVEVADDEFSDDLFLFGEIVVAKLVDQIVLE